MTNCRVTYNTGDNLETLRYEVWCVTINLCNIDSGHLEDRKLIGWVADSEQKNDCLEEILEAMDGDFLHFIDTETKPIGGEE